MRFQRVVLLIAATASLLSGQSREGEPFAGVWEAKYKGAVICTIKVTAGDRVSGAMYGCAVHVDDGGDLIDAKFDGDPDEPSPLLNAKVEGSTLVFEQKDDGPIKLELKLISPGRADLRFVNAPVKIKPVRFERK